jgi:hypothetical protein
MDMLVARYLPGVDQQTGSSSEDRNFVMLGMHLCNEPEAFRRAWSITGRLLERLNREVRKSGAKLLLFSVPARHEVNDAEMAGVKAEYSSPRRLCLEQAPGYGRLRELTQSLGIAYIDLLPAFRQASADDTALYTTDGHWNQAGHALAARLVSEVIE